jgi:hypothetical protein
MFPQAIPNAKNRGLRVGYIPPLDRVMSSLVFDGLDGNKDGCYNLVGTIIGANASVQSLGLYFNSISGGSYVRNRWASYGVTKSADPVGNVFIGSIEGVGLPNMIDTDIIISDGLISAVGSSTRCFSTYMMYQHWLRRTNRVENLTSVIVVVAGTTSIGIGTTLSLYRHG